MLNDLRFAVRQLLKSPAFTTIAVITLALGIGANTAIFSVVNAVLLRPPPFAEPEQLVAIAEHNDNFGEMSVAYPNFLDWLAQQRVLSGVAAFRDQSRNLTGRAQPERIDTYQVSASFFPTLGVQPIKGRVFTDAEDRIGGERVAVLSEGLWRRRFAGDPDILNKTLSLDGQPYAVIGIMPATFSFPRRVQLWTPIGHKAEWTDQRGWHPGIYVVGRLKPGVELPNALAGMQAVAAQLAKQYPDSNTGNSVRVIPLRERIVVRTVRAAMAVLLTATSLVLLIACANVANLLLARAAQRRKEIAVRFALGASRWQVVRQLLAESMLLAIIGGTGGLLLAFVGVKLLTALLPSFLTDFASVSMDRPVLFFTLASALATGFVFGLAPAWSLAREQPVEALKEGGRGEAVGVGRGWGRRALIVTEIALALTLLVGAGLLIRSFANLQSVAIGVNPQNVLVADLSLPAFKYPDRDRQLAFHRQALDRIRALPGVELAALIAPLPFGFGGWQTGTRIEGEAPPPPGKDRMTEMAIVSSDYFHAMGVQIVQGRAFTDADDGKNRVCIIDESFARKHFKGDALGKRVTLGGGGTNFASIVGIARHVKINGAAQDARIQTYQPVGQNVPDEATLVIRAARDPLALAGAVRQAVAQVDPDQPLANVRTMEVVVAQTIADRRLATLLLGIFAGLALLLAAVGIYGVMSFSVANRTREIGIRMALGAQRRDVRRLVLRQGGRLMALGAIIGLAAALGLTRLMQSLLFGVDATDWVTFGLTPLLLAGVAVAACLVPAQRAACIDPMEALRYE